MLSAAELRVRRPHVRDLVELAARLRPADRDELEACNHFDAQAAVTHSACSSQLCWAVHEGDTLLCIFGVCPLPGFPDVGTPWLLGTTALGAAHARTLIEFPTPYIALMLRAFPRLVNYVHADNLTSVRWLRRLGFVLDRAAPFGPNGAPFHRFEMTTCS